MFNPRRWLMLIAAVLALAIGAPLLFAQKPLNPKVAPLIPATPTGYLTDMAGVVKNPEEVNTRLSFIRDSLKLSLVAVVLPTIGDLQPEDVALDIGIQKKIPFHFLIPCRSKNVLTWHGDGCKSKSMDRSQIMTVQTSTDGRYSTSRGDLLTVNTEPSVR